MSATSDPSIGHVDAHAHVFRPASVHPRGVDALVPAERDAPLADLLSVMGAAGVSNAILIPLDDNDDYVAEVIASHAGQFVGVAVATEDEQGLTRRDPVESLRRRRSRYPFVALRTSWLGRPTEPIEASPMFPTLLRMAEDGIVLWSYLAPDQLPLLPKLVERLPELRVVLNHLGFTPHDMWVDGAVRPRFDHALQPELVQTICALGRHPNVYVLVSGHYALSITEPPYPDLHAPTRRIADAFGVDRLIWGSDYPWIRDVPGYDVTRDLVRTILHELDTKSLDRVLGGTARSLFSFSSSPTAPSQKEVH